MHVDCNQGLRRPSNHNMIMQQMPIDRLLFTEELWFFEIRWQNKKPQSDSSVLELFYETQSFEKAGIKEFQIRFRGDREKGWVLKGEAHPGRPPAEWLKWSDVTSTVTAYNRTLLCEKFEIFTRNDCLTQIFSAILMKHFGLGAINMNFQ